MYFYSAINIIVYSYESKSWYGLRLIAYDGTCIHFNKIENFLVLWYLFREVFKECCLHKINCSKILLHNQKGKV